MPFNTGTVDTFANTLITTPEVADTGDGATTIFTLQTTKKPIFIEDVEIEFTIGATTKTATSDSAGDFSAHSDITSGTIGEDGSLSITFATAPDDTTDISFLEYTSKGVLQKLIDTITAESYTEVVDTGDGVQTVFANTLSNTTIAKGQMLLRFKIDSFVHWVWDNGNDEFEHELISSSSINYGTGAVSITFADPIDDTFAVDIKYNTGAAGADWMLLLEQTAKDSGGSDAFPGLLLKEYVITNCGEGYADRVVIGLREAQNVATNQYNIEFNLYKDWNENEQTSGEWNFAGTYSQTYNSSTEHWSDIPTIATNDDEQTYWLSSTKDRVNGDIRVSGSVYVPFSFGIGKRIGASKKEYPKPYYVAGSGAANLIFSSTASSHISFLKPNDQDSFILINPNDDYQGANDFRISPTEDLVNPGDLKKTTNNKIVIFELHVVEFDPAPQRTLFEIDGVYYCNFLSLAAEDTFNDGVDDYIVFQDIFRTGNGDYFCMKKD